jgi:hypothetical protein
MTTTTTTTTIDFLDARFRRQDGPGGDVSSVILRLDDSDPHELIVIDKEQEFIEVSHGSQGEGF